MKKLLVLALILPIAIGACSNVKKNLGMERNQPDEFAVVERAPLTVPPNFNLLPPRPGAPAAQEVNSAADAKGLILGTQTPEATNSAAENDLLSQAGSAARKPVAKSEGSSLDPTEESVRLKEQNIKTPISPVMKNAQ